MAPYEKLLTEKLVNFHIKCKHNVNANLYITSSQYTPTVLADSGQTS